jgi:hypothetical protein
MADAERNAVIVLSDRTLLYVRSTTAHINAEIENRRSLALPVIPLVDELGRDFWLNANHITGFYEYDPDQPQIAFGR